MMDALHQEYVLTDLGLSYEQALHGIQSAVKFSHEHGRQDGSPKHLRTGLNGAMCDHAALARLLIQKGVITEDEYLEASRIGVNTELASYERTYGETFR